jgi:heptosyltransferase-2
VLPLKEIQKILVVTLSNLGDVVLTLPVIESLRQAHPDAKLHVIVGAQSAVVFEDDPRVEKVIAYNKRGPFSEKRALLGRIRSERYDLIVDLRRSLFGLLGGARYRNSYFYFPKKKLHRAQRHLTALRGLAEPLSRGSFLERGLDLPADARAFIGEERFVAAAVGSKADIKKWPAESYARLLDRLGVKEGMKIVLVGDAQDALQAKKVSALMRSSVLDLCGRTSFRELSSILARAALVVTNDSAPLHIADAHQTPVLAVFGPTDPGKYGPRGGVSRAVSKKLFCSPCEKAQCRFHHECMTELGVDAVYKEALKVLEETPHPKRPRILVSRLDRIGDVVLSMPSIEAVRKQYPESYLAVMTRPSTASLLEGHPWIDEVIPYFYEKNGRHSGLLGGIRFIRELVLRRFDIAFILHPSHRAHWAPFLAGIPYRIGLNSHDPFLLTKPVPDRRKDGLKHEADTTLDIVRAFGVPIPAEKTFSIATSYEDEVFVSETLAKAGIAGSETIAAFHLGASCVSKRWSAERFIELGKRFLELRGARIIVVGGSEEKELGRIFQERVGASVLDLTGQLSLKQLAELLRRCAVLVSNDSGPVHIAAAVNTRTLTIFGRNKSDLGPVRWRALGAGHEVIQKDVGCAVCLAHRCTIDFECLKAVSVETVWEALNAMIADRTEAKVFS